MNITEALLRDPNDGLSVFFGLFENRADIFLNLQLNELYRSPIRGTPKRVFLGLMTIEGLCV